jgi:hypothetical protein
MGDCPMIELNRPLIGIAEALESLRPGSKWYVNNNDYTKITWLEDKGGQTKPTKKEIEAEIRRLQEEYDNLEYQRFRKKEYPSVEEQLDILYHKGIEGWKREIDKVKNKYPKSQ